MKIDIFAHIMPKRYKEALYRYSDRFPAEKAVQDKRPVLVDLERRLKILDSFEGLTQVLSVAMPPVEEVVGPQEAYDLARISNDEMADLISKYPDKFITAIANLPLNNMEGAIKEAERAIKTLGFKGIQIYTRVIDKPPSTEEMMPLFELMWRFDLPIWIHPMRSYNQPDYPSEKVSYNQIFSIFGWPFDTTVAMTRLIFSGIFEKFPGIKFITHHCGGMVPYFADRIVVHYNNGLERLGEKNFPGLTKHPIEYFRMFYADTALNGGPSALMCGIDFFGEEHVLFGTDMPFDVENGVYSIRKTIDAIEKAAITEEGKYKIYEGNARRLLHL
ncbi:MAG: amidohydrolase [Syntrophorhabdaceae bacterium]|nr:amidohydrolase [Syntrophorhabdaceae bacterium]